MAASESPRSRIAFLRSLRSVRQFRPEPIPPEVLDDLLDVARWSGSASNRQPWELVVVRERATLAALAAVEGHAQHLEGAAAGVVLVMTGEPDRYEHETYDEGRLSERIMLAAKAYGIGSCIGWLRGDGVEQAKTLLGIPATRLVRTVLSLGYPAEPAPAGAAGRGRKPLGEFVYRERYGQRW